MHLETAGSRFSFGLAITTIELLRLASRAKFAALLRYLATPEAVDFCSVAHWTVLRFGTLAALACPDSELRLIVPSPRLICYEDFDVSLTWKIFGCFTFDRCRRNMVMSS